MESVLRLRKPPFLIKLLTLLIGLLCSIAARPFSFDDLQFMQQLKEQTHFILFDAPLTRAGRGDVAPAYAGARNFRAMGYRQRLMVVLSSEQDSAVLRELSLDYRLKSLGSKEAMITIEDGIEVYRHFDPYPEIDLPPPDIAFQFALRPSELWKDRRIFSAKHSFFYGVNNLESIPNSGKVKNKLVDAQGETVLLPEIGIAPSNLGVYVNRYAYELGQLPQDYRLYPLIKRLSLDQNHYREILAKDSNPWIEKLAMRNEKMAAYLSALTPDFFQHQTMATIYGVGAETVWNDFMDYLNSIPADKGALLWSPTVFSDESLQKLNQLAAQSLAPGKKIKWIKTDHDFNLKASAPGEIQIVLAGNFPHETYLHLNSVSNFPNLVSGDNAMADMLSMGKPFVMTAVDWNRPSMKGLAHFLAQFPLSSANELNQLTQIFNPDLSSRLLNSAFLTKPSILKTFAAAAKALDAHDLLKNSFRIIESTHGPSELTSDQWLAIKQRYELGLEKNKKGLNQMATLIELEQTSNITNLYKANVFDSELDLNYSAQNRSIFRVPYFWVPLEANLIQIAQTQNILPSLKDFYFHEIKGKKYFRFLSHPENYQIYAQLLSAKSLSIPAEKSDLIFIPSASERSGIIYQDNAAPDTTHWVKLSIPKIINKVNRIVRKSEIERSVMMSALVQKESALKNLSSVKFLPEPMGAFIKSDGQNLGGFLIREVDQVLTPGKQIMGIMSFLGEDQTTKEPHFFRFLSQADRKNPGPWLEKNILGPLGKIINEWHLGIGLTLEMHSQNLMIEVDHLSGPTGVFIYRDMGGVLPDLKRQVLSNSNSLKMGLTELEFRRLYQTYYADKQQSSAVHDYLKKQITDLFAIQFKKYGLIGTEEREELKLFAEKKLKQAMIKGLSNLTPEASWEQIDQALDHDLILKMQKNPNFTLGHFAAQKGDEENIFYFKQAGVDVPVYSLESLSAPWRRLTWLLDKDQNIIGYRFLPQITCDQWLPPKTI